MKNDPLGVRGKIAPLGGARLAHLKTPPWGGVR